MIKNRILQILIILFLLSFVVNTGRQVLKLNSAKKKFDKAVQKLENAKAENQKLAAELEFRETPEFVEAAARNKLGLAKEGEIVVILPKVEVEVRSNSQESNLKIWLKRLFGKNS